MTSLEVARLLGLSQNTVLNLAHGNVIPNERKGHRFYFHRADIERWMRDGKTAFTSQPAPANSIVLDGGDVTLTISIKVQRK
jgi:excisionase family DNA binding protein